MRSCRGGGRARPKLNWADRALLTTLLGVIPKARHHGLRLMVTSGHDPALAPRHRPPPRAARSVRGKTGRPATFKTNGIDPARRRTGPTWS